MTVRNTLLEYTSVQEHPVFPGVSINMGLSIMLECENHDEFVDDALENAFVNLDESDQIAFARWVIGYLAQKGVSL